MGRATGKEVEGSLRALDCGENLVGDTESNFLLYDPGDDIDPDCEVTSTEELRNVDTAAKLRE